MRASAALSNVEVTGTNLNITYVVLAISLLALAIAWVLRAQVLAASDGTEKMREIAEAVCQFGIAARHDCFGRIGTVLSESDFAHQEIAQGINPELLRQRHRIGYVAQ